MLGKQTNKQKPNRSKMNKQTETNQTKKPNKQEEHRKKCGGGAGWNLRNLGKLGTAWRSAWVVPTQWGMCEFSGKHIPGRHRIM